MNLLDRKIRLIFLSALFLCGCEDPDTIGLQINPDQDLLVEFAEIPIKTTVILVDSINTSNTGRWLFGNYQDPITGRISAEGYSKLRPEILSDVVPDDAELDSAVLVLSINYRYGVDFESEQHLAVRELLDTISLFRNYHSTQTASKATPMVETSFVIPFDKDSILRIDVPAGTVEELFQIIKAFDYSNQDEFNQLFHGIALTSNPSNSVIYGVNPNTLDTSLKLYYSSPGDENFSEFEFFFNSVSHYSYISADFQGTAMDELTEFYQEIVPFLMKPSKSLDSKFVNMLSSMSIILTLLIRSSLNL